MRAPILFYGKTVNYSSTENGKLYMGIWEQEGKSQKNLCFNLNLKRTVRGNIDCHIS